MPFFSKDGSPTVRLSKGEYMYYKLLFKNLTLVLSSVSSHMIFFVNGTCGSDKT